MDYKERQVEQNRSFTESEQHSGFLGIEFNDLKSDQSLFFPRVDSDYDTNSACSRDLDRNVGLQVVPSFDDEVFSDSFFPNIDYDEQKGICQNQIGTNYQLPAENVGKLFQSLACLPGEGILGGGERTDMSDWEMKIGENEGSPERRRQSDTDSLDVYLKPCVITPTKVEDLYSTLEEEDKIIFQFPPKKESSLTFPGSNVQTVQENDAPTDSNVFQIQLCNLSHHEDLNIETSNDRNLESAHHSNECFEETSHCSMVDIESSHRLASRQSLAELEAQIKPNKDSSMHFPSFLSNATEYQAACAHPEENSSSFPPLLEEMSSQIFFPPKPTNICQSVSKVSISLDFNDKEYLHIGNTKREQEGIPDNKKCRHGFLSRDTMEEAISTINVFQKNSEKITSFEVQNLNPTIVSRKDEKTPAQQIIDSQHIKHLSRCSKTIEEEGCRNMLSPNNDYSKKVEEMSVDEEQGKVVIKEQPLRESRMNHNDTEKQRRDQMKSRFESLRQVIPRIEKLEKTPKIQILKQAWKYITYLEEEGRSLELIKRKEKQKNLVLLKKLQNIVKI